MTDRKALHGFWGTSPILAILLLGLALRLHGLATQSLWNDEGNTARLVERSPALIIEGAAGDIHPPGYYLLLHGWRALSGDSEFALRSYSTWCSVLSIALAAALGKRLSGLPGAVLAALAVAVNPLSVYYSQEARMYAQLGLATGLTLWAAAHLVDQVDKGAATLNLGRGYRWRSRIVPILVLALAIAFGLYTQYAYIFALIGLNAGLALYWLLNGRRMSLIGPWVLANLLGGGAFLPWAPIALRASGWQPPDLGAQGALSSLVRALVVGVTLPQPRASQVLYGVTALTGLALLAQPRARFLKWMGLGMLWAPVLLIVALGAYRPAYLKFMMAAVVPLALLPAMALGTARPAGRHAAIRARRLGAIAILLALLPSQVRSLSHLYQDPAYRRDDYRGIAASVAQTSRPGDAILLDAPNQWEVFTYYYDGPLAVYPAPYRPSLEETEAWLRPILDEHPRLLVIYWGDGESDPPRYIEAALARLAYKAGESWEGNVRVTRYGTAALPETPDTEIAARLGSNIRLKGSALPTQRFQPGDVIPLTLFWEAESPIAERYKVFVHLIDSEGTLVAQTDNEPGGGFALSDRWQTGDTLIDRYGVALPADLPAGEYALWVGMYGFTGERLPVSLSGRSAGDALRLRVIMIGSPQ